MGLYLLDGQNLKSIVFYSAWNYANEYYRMDRQNKRLSIDFWFKKGMHRVCHEHLYYVLDRKGINLKLYCKEPFCSYKNFIYIYNFCNCKNASYNIIWDWFLFGLQHNINVHDIPEGVSDLQIDLFYSKKLTFVCQVH